MTRFRKLELRYLSVLSNPLVMRSWVARDVRTQVYFRDCVLLYMEHQWLIRIGLREANGKI